MTREAPLLHRHDPGDSLAVSRLENFCGLTNCALGKLWGIIFIWAE